VSLTGNWMNTTASAWLAYELSQSPFVVGLLAFASHIPILVLSPVAGVWGDRIDRRKLLIALQVLCCLQSATLAFVTFTGAVSVTWLLTLSTLRGLTNAVEFPTRQAFIVDLVTRREDLQNAIALNSTLFNLARLLGPSLAGVIIVVGGAAGCYLLDTLSYLGILAALFRMSLPPRPPAAARRHPLDELREGLRYAAASPALRPPLLLVAVMSFVAFSASTLAPVFASDVFGRDARTLGLMYGCVGLGALGGALYLSSRSGAAGLDRWVARGAFLIGFGQAGFALSPVPLLAYASLVVTGIGTVLTMAGSNTLIQASVEDDKRGRVMGLFTMGQGMFPLGSVAVGALATAAGPRVAVTAAAVVCLLAALVFRRSLRMQRPAAPTPFADLRPPISDDPR
jgi:MFS family permease